MKNKLILIATMGLIGCASMFGNSNGPISEAQANKMTIDELNTAIVKDPNNVYLHLARANYFAKNKSLDYAQEEYKIALTLKPHDADIELLYANFLCNRKYDIYSAGMFYSRALNESNSTIQADVYSDYASCMVASEHYDNAQDMYLRALGYDNPPLSAYAGLTKLYDKQGNYALANYYASLYEGPTTAASLDMQIKALGKLIDSDTAISNRTELKARYNRLNKQYYDLTDKKFAEVDNNTPDQNIAEPEVINISGNSDDVIAESKPAIRTIIVKDVPVKPVIVPNTATTAVPQALPPKSSVKSTEVKSVEAAITNPSSSQRIMKDAKTGRNYVVVEQDESLWAIQRATKVPVAKLEQLNNIQNAKIKPGNKLFID